MAKKAVVVEDVEKIIEEVKEVVAEVISAIKVELKDPKMGFHSIFTSAGTIDFVDGSAEVSPSMVGMLKATDLIK